MLEFRHHPLQMKISKCYNKVTMNKYNYFNDFIKGSLVVFITILFSFTVAEAGTITPPSGTPVAQFYTLSEIYEFITNNTTATVGGHAFTFSDTLAGGGKTLTEIYNALASLVSVDKVKLGTTYLIVAGTLTPNGGTATAAGVFNGLTAHLSGDWDLDTGTLDLACNTATFNATANLVATAYDGAGDGTNRWCMTNSGDATAAQMKTGVVAWIDGAEVTGSGTQTLSAGSTTVNAGYYEAANLATVDADLTAANILSTATIFGVTGSATAGYTYSTGPRTGQTVCSDASGTVISCTGTGQDGEHLKGVARSYTDNSNGTITDNVTGVIWQKCIKGLSGASCGTGTAATDTWANALTYCNANTAGLPGSNWRLPNIYELFSIVDFGDASTPFIDATNFPATTTGNYWSSTSRPASFSGAMNVNFNDGSVNPVLKSNSLYIRCVRG